MQTKMILTRIGSVLLTGSLTVCVQTSTASSTTSGAATSGANGAVDPAAMIAAHNEWRAKVGVPGLQWSDKLAGVAQKWADHIASTSCSLGHSGNEYGENIFYASSLMYSDGRTEVSKKTAKMLWIVGVMKANGRIIPTIAAIWNVAITHK